MQEETDIMNFEYEEVEVENYVVAIQKVIKNLDVYKSNCRNRILEGFTIDQMVEKMSKIFEEVRNTPQKEKVQIGKNLKNNIDITKELINLFFIADKLEYRWLCDEYNKIYFGPVLYTRWARIKDKLWGIPLYRGFIRILQKLGIIKLIKKILRRV